MKSWNLLPLLTVLALVMAAQANAQTAEVEGTDVVISESGAEAESSYESLSTGNRKIATALYEAQGGAEGVEGVDGAYTLDDIAAMKQDGTGWGELFKELQAAGEIPADVKNLGQLVSGKYQATDVVTSESGTEAEGTETETTESGTETEGTETETTESGSETAGTGTVTSESGAEAESSYESLSTGNRKIATALYEAQGGAEGVEGVDGAYTLDDIAAMKQDGTGWGELFKELQAEGQIPADVKNLGHLVSGKYQAMGEVTTDAGAEAGGTDAVTTVSGSKAKGGSAPGSSSGGRGKGTIVVTTAAGGQIVVERGNRRSQGAGTGASGKAKTSGGGAGHGHDKGGGHSVTVTTAGGGSVTAGGGNAKGLGHGKGGVTVSTAGGVGGGYGHGVKVAGGGGKSQGTGPKK